MSLAAERTYLAYVRTALALLAGGVAVVAALPEAGHLGLRRTIGCLLVLLALVSRQRQEPLASGGISNRRGDPLPQTRMWTATVSAGVFVAGLLALALVVLT